jgi:hypothetical protein
MKTYYNFGCGQSYHPAWSNFDVNESPPYIKYCNIVKPLPIPSGVAEVVYHSNVIEHLSRPDAFSFLSECYRILAPGGHIRVVAPDLEAIVIQYINSLSKVIEDKKNEDRRLLYEWSLIELFDQLIREKSGGEMRGAILNSQGTLKKHIVDRLGLEAEPYFTSEEKSFFQRLRGRNFRHLLVSAMSRIRATQRNAGILALRMIAGADVASAARAGIFRSTGETHRWMYDRFSMSDMLSNIGFRNIQVPSAYVSAIPQFQSYSLDVVNGKPRKPDSFYVEGQK